MKLISHKVALVLDSYWAWRSSFLLVLWRWSELGSSPVSERPAGSSSVDSATLEVPLLIQMPSSCFALSTLWSRLLDIVLIED